MADLRALFPFGYFTKSSSVKTENLTSDYIDEKYTYALECIDVTALGNLETVLGPRSTRYFGSGYRDVRHEFLNETNLTVHGAETVARIIYPSTWSLDTQGNSREPHLSTIDAFLLPIKLLGMQEQNPELFVTRFNLRASSGAWTDLEHVPVSLRLSGTALPNSFQFRVGNIRGSFELSRVATALSTRKLQKHLNVYDDFYRAILPETQLLRYNEATATLQAEHQFQLCSDYNQIPPKGIESAYWPSLTVVDYLVLMGQLSQALLELRYQTGRSGTLWMRRVSLSMGNKPQPLNQPMTSAMTIVRDKYLQRAGRKIRDIAVEAVTSSGALLRADLAYEEGV